MKKYMKISFLVFLLASISLSGCLERDIKIIGDIDRVELLSYEIGAFDKNKNKIGDNLIFNDDLHHYKITGEVKNIGDTPMDKIWVSIKFLDRNNKFLDSGSYLISYLAINQITNFSITYLVSDQMASKIWNVNIVIVAINQQ